MKLILFVGLIILLDIVTCLKPDHENHSKRKSFGPNKKIVSLEEKENVHGKHSPRSPLGHVQRKFKEYANKWERFSNPNTKWHQVKTKKEEQKKNHVDNGKKEEKRHPEHLVNLKHKNIRDKIQKKKNRSSEKRNSPRNHMADRFSRRHSMKSYMDTHKRFEGRRLHKFIQKYRNQRRGHMKPFDLNGLDKKDHERKGNKGDHLKINRGVGRPGYGPKPFARGNKQHLSHESSFCKKRESRKCPEYKKEICGNDGKTYQNRCLLMEEMCKKDSKIDIHMARRGACVEKILN